MITKENLKEVILSIPKKRLNQVFNNKKDWLLIQLCIFNTGTKVYIENKYYHEKHENYAYQTGNLFLHKDTFFDLLHDFNINF
jgi:hypothetical protein